MSTDPTAQMLLAETMAIPLSCPGPGLETTLHLVPFQCRVRVCTLEPLVNSPTAQMLVAETVATPGNSLFCVPTLGLDTTFHPVPFQCRMRICSLEPLMNSPTVQMLVAETAATPLRKLFCVPGLGLDTTLHFVPFQCSMRVCSILLAFRKSPTAQTLLVEMAVTAFRKPTCFGVGTTRQLVPFQCSMSGGVAVLTLPTAQISLVETAATPRRASSVLALGLGTTFHFVPFQCSVSVCWSVSPTAQTSLAEI